MSTALGGVRPSHGRPECFGGAAREFAAPPPGMIAWFDAGYGVTKDEGSDRVTSWASRTGEFTARQSSAASMPLLSADGMGSNKASLIFDGNDDQLRVENLGASFESTNTFTWIYAKSAAAEASTRFIISVPTSGGIINSWWNGQEVFERQSNGLGPYSTIAASDVQKSVVVNRYDGSNGLLILATASEVKRQSLPFSGSVGSAYELYVGGNRDKAYAFQGSLGEMLFYKRSLSDSEINLAMDYLRAKWCVF